MLSALYPGRIDLGIGRAPGSDRETMFALQRDRRQMSPDDFPEQLAELLAYLEDAFPDGHPLARLAALPGGAETPEVWLLGSSPQSAIWAGELGLPYVFADFINPAGAEIAQLYRDRFVPSVRRAEPYVGVAMSVVCAETDEEAERLASSSRMAMTLLRQGRLIAVPPVERALAFFEEHPPPTGRRAIVGSPAKVRPGIEEVVEGYGADEAMIVTITFAHDARRRSYELVADAFR
jgi:luciferase family oxidoreductase group 1